MLLLSCWFPSKACPDRALGRPVFFYLRKRRLSWAKIIILTLEGSTKMIDRLIQCLIKTFMPSPATLAKMAAKQIQEAVNGC